MIIVSNTTPLNYLVLIDSIDVLPRLFSGVYAPPAVVAELTAPRAPEPVRQWASHPPAWLSIESPATRLPSTARLHPGEAEAISLAKQVAARAILLDERDGRRVAMAEGLVVVGTLALVELAAERGLLELRPALNRLLGTTFRVTRDLVEAALARDAARHRSLAPDVLPDEKPH